MFFFDLGTSAVVAEVPRHGNHGDARRALFVPEGCFGVSHDSPQRREARGITRSD